INKTINDAELRSGNIPLSKAHIQTAFKSICEQIAETFHCIEASLFLHADLEAPERYELMATTWEGRFKKRTYHANVREGVTGWVLSRATPVKIFDFANFERDKTEIRKTYPNLIWRDSLNIKKAARDRLGLTDDDQLPPLSFM